MQMPPDHQSSSSIARVVARLFPSNLSLPNAQRRRTQWPAILLQAICDREVLSKTLVLLPKALRGRTQSPGRKPPATATTLVTPTVVKRKAASLRTLGMATISGFLIPTCVDGIQGF